MTRSIDRQRGACALIAIKERSRCKTRLAGVLGEAERLALVRSMLRTVVQAAENAELVDWTFVVSPERDEIPLEIPVLADSGESLNGALTQAQHRLRELDCREIVVLPADLPRITAAEIDALVRACRAGGFAIAPDAAGGGTNALCLGSTQPFLFQFGPNSRSLHLQEARRRGLIPRVVQSAGLACDVDSPPDLALLLRTACVDARACVKVGGEDKWLAPLRA